MEWWKLWVPFVGTIFGIVANVFINFVQSTKQQKFQKELNDKQQLFQKEIAKKQIDADVILKSRLHWIDNTKSIASEFLIDALKLVTVNASLVENYKNVAIWKNLKYKNDLDIESDEIELGEKRNTIDLEKIREKMLRDYRENIIQSNNQINKLIYRTSKNNTLLLLNFSDNDENNKIIDLVKDINNNLRRTTREVKELEVNVNNEEVNWDFEINKSYHEQTSINQKVEKLTLILRDYYKNEWERVKAG